MQASVPIFAAGILGPPPAGNKAQASLKRNRSMGIPVGARRACPCVPRASCPWCNTEQGQDGPATHGQDARATAGRPRYNSRARPAGSGRDGPWRTVRESSKPARRGLHPLARVSRPRTPPMPAAPGARRPCYGSRSPKNRTINPYGVVAESSNVGSIRKTRRPPSLVRWRYS